MGQVTQVLQVRGGSRRPRLRLHGSVAGVVSRAPRTGCLRTHRSLREARDYPEGEAELPETGGEEKGEEELEKEEQERCWESKGREEGRSWEMGRACGREGDVKKSKIQNKRPGERRGSRGSVCCGERKTYSEMGGAERGRMRGKKE